MLTPYHPLQSHSAEAEGDAAPDAPGRGAAAHGQQLRGRARRHGGQPGPHGRQPQEATLSDAGRAAGTQFNGKYFGLDLKSDSAYLQPIVTPEPKYLPSD